MLIVFRSEIWEKKAKPLRLLVMAPDSQMLSLRDSLFQTEMKVAGERYDPTAIPPGGCIWSYLKDDASEPKINYGNHSLAGPPPG